LFYTCPGITLHFFTLVIKRLLLLLFLLLLILSKNFVLRSFKRPLSNFSPHFSYPISSFGSAKVIAFFILTNFFLLFFLELLKTLVSKPVLHFTSVFILS